MLGSGYGQHSYWLHCVDTLSKEQCSMQAYKWKVQWKEKLKLKMVHNIQR